MYDRRRERASLPKASVSYRTIESTQRKDQYINKPSSFAVRPHVDKEVRTQKLSSGPWPMEVDATHVGQKISQKERQRRYDMHLCLYCGQEGHIRAECPQRPKKPVTFAVTTIKPNTRIAIPQLSGNANVQHQ